MSKCLNFMNNVIDQKLRLCDKCWQSGLSKKMRILQNNYSKGVHDGTVPALKIHAKLEISLKISSKLFPNRSTFHGNTLLGISPERASSLSQSSLPSFSPLLPVAKAKEWK